MGLIEGEVVYEDLFGNPLVVKAETTTTTNGDSVKTTIALKIREPGPLTESEASMTDYISTQSKRDHIDVSGRLKRIMVPQFISCYAVYDVYNVSDKNKKPRIVAIIYSDNNGVGNTKKKPKFVAIVSDFVDGDRLSDVWSAMKPKERDSIKEQLKNQIELFRKQQQPYIGCIKHQQTVNFYKRNEFMGPFDSEVEFDTWCRSRIKSHRGPIFGFIEKMKWKWKLHSLRGEDSSAFVLTHGDLAARNIIVRREEIAGIVDWKIAGIVDWEYSGFLPEWAEYAIAKEISHHEEWWEPILLEVLEPFKPTVRRLKFQALLVNPGF